MNETAPDDPATALAFLRRAAVALCDTGVPISYITARIQAVASAFGLDDMTVFALPTGVFLRTQDGMTESARALGTLPGSSVFRLDQMTALHRLLDDAALGRCPPVEALVRLDAIEAAEPPYRWATMAAGHALFGLGFGLLLQPTLLALPLYAALSALVGGASQLVSRARRPAAAVVYPALAAFVVTVVAKVVAPHVGEAPSRALIPPLVSLMPTAAMTYAVIDLSTGDAISGAARLALAVQRFVLLGFGAYAAAELLTPERAVANQHTLGWGPWLGVAVFCVGCVLTQSGAVRTLPYLLLIAYATFAVQYVTTEISGPVLGGVAAGIATVATASALRRFPHAPPFYAGFVPVLWLIVPGGIGLHGVVDLGLRSPAAVGELCQAAMIIIAQSIGMLIGSIAHLFPEGRVKE